MTDADSTGMRTSLLIVAISLALAPHRARAQTLELTAPLAVSHFRPGASAITQADRDDLRDVIDWANTHPWRLVIIQGYGDTAGDSAGNLNLSQDRADAARDVLIDLGLDPARIVAGTAYGAVGLRGAGRVDVRGTLDDFRNLISAQHVENPRQAPASSST